MKPLLQHGVDSVVENRDISWDDIGGLDDVKLKLQQVTILRSIEFCVH